MKSYLSIQCTASNGIIGTFLSDAEGKLVSPVCADSVELYRWTYANGWKVLPYDRQHPVGVYEKETL